MPRRILNVDDLKAETLSRDLQPIAGEVRKIDAGARTVEMAFSSEAPYERWWGTEILDHKPDSMRRGRLDSGAAVLVNHDFGDQVGVVESARIDADGVGRAIVRFGKSKRAKEIFTDVADGIRKLVSVGYRIHEMVLEKQSDAVDTYRVTDWEPYEISIVSVPADPNVGVGRDAQTQKDYDMPKKAESQTQTQTQATNEPAQTHQDAPVDTKQIAREARAAELTRIREISAIGNEFGHIEGVRELEQKHLDEELDINSMRQGVLALMREEKGAKPGAVAELGLSEKEVKNFRFSRALNALANPNDRRAQEAAAYELEVCQEAQNRSDSSAMGLMIPPDILNRHQRDLNVTVNATGGAATVATDLLAGQFIDLLRNQSVVNRMGATMLTDLQGNIAIPRQTGSGTAYWIATEGGDPTESDQTIDQVPMSPKTLGAFTDYTRQVLKQSSIDIEAFIQNDLRAVMALAIDSAALYGSGAGGQPTGLANVTGVNAVAFATAGAPTYPEIVELETAIAVDNADAGTTQTVVNPTMRGTLKTTQKFSGTNGSPVWEGTTLNGYNATVSNQVNANDIIHGDWSNLLIGMWGGLDLMVDPFTHSTSGTVRIVTLQSMDIAVRNPVYFAIGQ